jgi:hypothetical protein
MSINITTGKIVAIAYGNNVGNIISLKSLASKSILLYDPYIYVVYFGNSSHYIYRYNSDLSLVEQRYWDYIEIRHTVLDISYKIFITKNTYFINRSGNTQNPFNPYIVISGNYSSYTLLFDTQNHPNGILGCFVSKEICKALRTKGVDIELIDISEFTQGHIMVVNVRFSISKYTKRELDLRYISDEECSGNSTNEIKKIYNNPQYVKNKTI